MEQQPITMPDLGLPAATLRTTVWLVRRGAEVTAGDRLLEVVAGVALVDISAPVSGRLVRQLVGEDEVVQPGQALGMIEPDPHDS